MLIAVALTSLALSSQSFSTWLYLPPSPTELQAGAHLSFCHPSSQFWLLPLSRCILTALNSEKGPLHPESSLTTAL